MTAFSLTIQRMATETTENDRGDVSLWFSSFLQIALGTVTNVEEAVKWLSYTYLYVRMRANPLVYGINHKAFQVGEAFVAPLGKGLPGLFITFNVQKMKPAAETYFCQFEELPASV